MHAETCRSSYPQHWYVRSPEIRSSATAQGRNVMTGDTFRAFVVTNIDSGFERSPTMLPISDLPGTAR